MIRFVYFETAKDFPEVQAFMRAEMDRYVGMSCGYRRAHLPRLHLASACFIARPKLSQVWTALGNEACLSSWP